LSDLARRRNYDDFRFGELIPYSSHKIFNDFFNTKPFLLEDDKTFFKPIMETASTMQKQFDREWNRECNKDWNKDWVDFGKLAPGTEYA